MSKPVQVILVRWPKGMERINVTLTDTIGAIVDRMAKKHNFDGSKHTLILESTNTKIARAAKLSQLKINNGEIFQLDMATHPDSTPSDSTSFPKSGPIAASIQRFKSEWGPNAVCLKEILGEKIVIEQQEKGKISKVLLPLKETAMVAHIIEELHFSTPRIFFLYGTLPHPDVVRVHSISFPAQKFDSKTGEFKFDEKHRKTADDLAKLLGLQLVGAIVFNSIKSPPISPLMMMYLAKLHKQIGDHFIICSGLPENGKCAFELFQLSDQFVDLASKNFFSGVDGNTSLKTKETVVAYTKSTDTLAVEYFLINVRYIARESWFPRARFPFQSFYPTVADFSYIMNLDYAAPDFVRLLDFNLILFLEQWFNPGNEIPMMVKILIAKKELPYAYTSKLDDIRGSAAITT